MKTEKEIKQRIKFLEKLMKRYEKTMNAKVRKVDIFKVEEAEEMYYECVVEINALNWVLGVKYEMPT